MKAARYQVSETGSGLTMSRFPRCGTGMHDAAHPRLAEWRGPSTVVKYVVLLQRSAGMTRAAFLQHWLNLHTPMVAQLPGIRGYALSPTVAAAGYESDYDGIGELWFDSVEEALAAFNTPEGRALRADTQRFADSERAIRFFAQDTKRGGAVSLLANG